MYFNISSFGFSMYKLCLIVALITGFIFVYINLRDNKVPRKIVILTLFLSVVSIMVGGKLFTLFTNEKAVNFKSSTISSSGSAIALVLMLIIFTKIYKKNSQIIFASYLLSAPLMYAISKIGCFFAGCCLGLPYNGIFRVEYHVPRTNAIALPIQLIEAIVFFIIFVVYYILHKKGYKKGFIESLIFTGAFFKFLLDFLRETHVDGFTITVNQKASIVTCIILGIVICLKRRKKIL